MNLFFFKSNKFYPLLFIIAKLSSNEEFEYLEKYTNDIFQILINKKEATEENILIFSIIKDYNKSTINLILPAIKSNVTLSERCFNDTKFVNSIIIEILKKMETEFYFELNNDDTVIIYLIKVNLMGLIKYYKTNVI